MLTTREIGQSDGRAEDSIKRLEATRMASEELGV
jgi:hypothetical protein